MLRSIAAAMVFVGMLACGAVAHAASCPPVASTYDLIQQGIFQRHGCTQSFCHGTSRQGGLDLRAANSYASLLQGEDGEAEQHEKTEGAAVEPGHPEDSLLWELLAAKTLGLKDPPGVPMPAGGLPISRDELEGIRLWILAGAPQDGTVEGVSDLIDACPPPTPAEDGPLPPLCQPGETDLLLPNLVVDTPRDVRVIYQGGHRVISFTTGVANTGDGPLIVQAGSTPTAPGQSVDALQIIVRADGSKCTRSAGALLFEYEGLHWAYGSMADFELRKDDPRTGPILARSSKTAFCLLDSDPIRASENRPHQFEAHCEDNIGRMGISAGYKDVYYRIHPGQWIDLDADPTTAVPVGTYYLVNIADPNNTLLKMNEDPMASASFTRVTVRLPDPDPPEVAPTPPLQPTPPAPGHRPRPPHAPHAPRAAHAPHVHAAHHPVHVTHQ